MLGSVSLSSIFTAVLRVSEVMTVNLTSDLNVTPHHLNFYIACQNSVASIALYVAYTCANVLLLPLYIFILHVSLRRWRRQHTISHSDIFTCHMIVVEMAGMFGAALYCLGYFAGSEEVSMLGVLIFNIIFPGQATVHTLTCVELYLAAAHPVNYMRVREPTGVRLRNICMACVWLLCCGWIGVTHSYLPEFPLTPFLCCNAAAIVVICPCCLSVLHVLRHPRPGEVAGHNAGQSKRRAFYAVTLIAGVLLLRFGALLVCVSMYFAVWLPLEDLCWVIDFGIWFILPSSLVLPLLFLHRNTSLACSRNTKPEERVW